MTVVIAKKDGGIAWGSEAVGDGATVFVRAGEVVGDGSTEGVAAARVSAARVSAARVSAKRGSRVALDDWDNVAGTAVGGANVTAVLAQPTTRTRTNHSAMYMCKFFLTVLPTLLMVLDVA